MSITPFKQKVEERAQAVKKVEEPPAKRQCAGYEKQLQKLPGGDLSLVKDCLTYIYIYIFKSLYIL